MHWKKAEKKFFSGRVSFLECFKKQRHYFANKGPSNQSYGFSSSHIWMWELDYKEGWALKNWCFWTVMLEKTFFFFILVFLFFFNFILRFNFTILYWFCHIATWIHHRYTRVSHPEPSSLLPPHDAWSWCTGEDSWESLRLQGDQTSPS